MSLHRTTVCLTQYLRSAPTSPTSQGQMGQIRPTNPKQSPDNSNEANVQSVILCWQKSEQKESTGNYRYEQ